MPGSRRVRDDLLRQGCLCLRSLLTPSLRRVRHFFRARCGSGTRWRYWGRPARLVLAVELTPAGRTVRAENPAHGSDQQACHPSRLAVMITGHVPAVRLSPDHADRYMAAAVPA